MLEDDRWCGQYGPSDDDWSDGAKLADLFGTKALLNDSTSGGQYLIPEDFDTAIITFPLLHSELVPSIDMRTMTRDTIEGASIGNPSVTWNQTEGSALTLFNTASLIAQLSTDA